MATVREQKQEPYPWNEWFLRIRNKASKLVLKQGTHFDCQVHGMVAQIRTAAGKRNRKVNINVTEETITITKAT